VNKDARKTRRAPVTLTVIATKRRRFEMDNFVIGILIFVILGLIVGFQIRVKFTQLKRQVAELRIEHEALKNNLIDLGVLKSAQ
jgi:cell division protein FtsB